MFMTINSFLLRRFAVSSRNALLYLLLAGGRPGHGRPAACGSSDDRSGSPAATDSRQRRGGAAVCRRKHGFHDKRRSRMSFERVTASNHVDMKDFPSSPASRDQCLTQPCSRASYCSFDKEMLFEYSYVGQRILSYCSRLFPCSLSKFINFR